MITMEKSVLMLDRVTDSTYQTIIKNNHGRRIYLRIEYMGDTISICNCFYIDRPMRNSGKAIPQKWKTNRCSRNSLIDVLTDELDKRFYGIEFSDTKIKMSPEEYIAQYLRKKNKYKFLILVEANGILKTRLKNRVHRTIYLEIKDKHLIQNCHYCDRCYKRNNQLITPFGLKTIYFEYSTKKLLEIVNDELNCDFTDIVITSDTFGFDESNIPICGSI